MRWVRIDALDDRTARLEWEGRAFEVPRALVPQDAREGDVLAWTLQVDEAATRAARTATAERLKRLTRNDDGGDFSL